MFAGFFLAFGALGLLCLVTSVVLAFSRRRLAAGILVANGLVLVLCAGVVYAMTEARYHDCIEQVKAACPHNECSGDYSGPFIPDCNRKRLFP